jgi:asparagine synthase (glutamine-hydrolysing)
MCGIAGFSFSHPFDGSAKWLQGACQRLSHRGPDGSGYFEDYSSGVGLVHTRLSIQDLTVSGNQPMHSPDRTVALVFNGEIYNFRELRAELIELGYIFLSDCDTEVLLALYLTYRNRHNVVLPASALRSLLSRLNGIFAFALWDSKFSSLLLVRDPFGVKPLYIKTASYGLYFASEAKLLYSSDSALDFCALDRYLTFLWCPGDRTPDSKVKKLGPGEALWISRGSIVQHSKWFQLPAFRRTLASESSSPPSDFFLQTADLLRLAVHRQMISDVPVGAFLSGGLDSSSVVAFARELKPDLRCFTIDVTGTDNDGFSDDLPYARRAATHLGVQLHVLQVDAARMAGGIEDMVWQLDEPLSDPAPLNVLLISRLAREHGIKVLLSGAGGDDLFTGYRRHYALRLERLWGWLPRSLRARLRYLNNLLPSDQSFGRRLSKYFSGAHLDGDARLVHYFRWIERADLHALYTPAFRDALCESHCEDPMIDFLADLPNDTTPLERMLALEQRFFLTDHNLTYTDKMSMAAGLEVRVPFLDLDLVEFAARVPCHYKQRGRQGKWLLKKAMEPYLPHDVIYRSKSGFGLPLRRWLRVELRDWLSDILSYESLHRRGLFDPLAVRSLITANSEGALDASYTLLSLACTEIWCRHFIDVHGSPLPSTSI